MFWSVEADTSAVLLTQSPIVLPTAGNLSSELRDPAAQPDDQGEHMVFTVGKQAIRLLRLPGAPAGTALAALVPLDADGFDRIDAIDRLLRALQGRTVPDDRRLTPQQRRRHRQMLQATDGRLNGASYRDVAIAMFGPRRVAAEPWKTSPLRATIIGLVHGGRVMIAGGYRQLLRHRRKE
ncbi:hypothetical protein GCM10007913_44710 [Devosia yakushimensis]|uniref:T6SS Transcription factor RovC-like DNA binding domain-containing protein n=1 Tax=Devosia yakushimensis TaxID=470028 RepID=A0ABQ5ULL2_9HYPH|nr:DUF2285 domain-containing protein [Devosia yakushimensis]GLQ12538.1 hypothetical protein GCM10007913_44710 [Devosia yakushimensis]